jgi:hypothetical protein
LPPWLYDEFFIKHTAPGSLVMVLDHFHQIKQSGNFGGVVGGQLLKWNLMSSESECLPYLYRRRFSFWYLLNFEGPLKVSRPGVGTKIPEGAERKTFHYVKI